MSKFEVGQKWFTRDGRIADIVAITDDEVYPVDTTVGGKPYFYTTEGYWLSKHSPQRDDLVRLVGSDVVPFSTSEIYAMATNPDVLRALANQHSEWEMKADAFGNNDAGHAHMCRADELRKLADKIEADS